MPDYKNAVIYMLEPSIEYDDGDIYYGSTTQPLYKRFYEHKSYFKCDKPIKSKMIFEKYGIENIKIILVKYFPCENQQELGAEEAKYIRENKCVNANIPGRSRKERAKENKETIKEKIKEYREKNKETIKEKNKEYYGENKETIKVREKLYREKNKEKIRERKKRYYEKIKEKISEIIKCECGCDITKCLLIRHKKTIKHIHLMNVKNLKTT